MDLFTYITQLENTLKQRINSDIVKITQKQHESALILKHDHQPQIGLVPNCKYCQKYGNILQFGEVSINETDLNKTIYCFSN